eukprot:11751581-Alexandrium_andersonii.AAC.1
MLLRSQQIAWQAGWAETAASRALLAAYGRRAVAAGGSRTEPGWHPPGGAARARVGAGGRW